MTTYKKIFLNKNLEYKKVKSNTVVTSEKVITESLGVWTIDGRDFSYSQFSDGEKTLFAYALFFFLHDINPNRSISNSIVIIDEPELHLHASAQIKLIESLSELLNKNGQLWITTHSIPIIASSKYNEIFLIKNGKIHSPSRKNPADVINELLNTDLYLLNLQSYLNSISSWMYTNFITQCFVDPDIISDSPPADPQIQLFKNIIKNKNNINALDFGAGHGRILKSFEEDISIFKKSFKEFDAFDIKAENSIKLLKLGYSNFYSNINELKESFYEVILVCNVLHEIPITQWVLTLNKLIKSLKNDGILL